MEWLFEKYNNDDIIVIDSDNEDDETLAESMPSNIAIRWALSRIVSIVTEGPRVKTCM